MKSFASGIAFRLSLLSLGLFSVGSQLGAAVTLRVNHALHVTADALEGSEEVIAPVDRQLDASLLGRFPALSLQGDNTLLVVASKNEFKVKLLSDKVKKALSGQAGRLIVHPYAADSGVNEQPYNGYGTQGAGVRGAAGRIRSVMAFLESEAGSKLLAAESIGRVLIGSVENYIELYATTAKGTTRPADFGVVTLCNVGSHSVVTAISEGVTVDPRYVLEAMGYGFGVKAPDDLTFKETVQSFPDIDYDTLGGNMTVGKVLARHAYGVAHDDWHKVVAHSSRYTLLKIAAAGLNVPL